MSASSKELAGTGHASGPSTPGDASGVDLEEPRSEAESVAAPNAGGQPPDVEAILSSVRETAYRWDFKSDRIDWAPNAAAVLAVADPAKIARGRAFALLFDPDQAGARYDGITGGPHASPDSEIRYSLRYRLLPEGRRGRAALWVEDTGICRIGPEGRPSVAQGMLRAVADRREREERLQFLGGRDELTGQLNRTRLTEELTRFLGSAGRVPAKGAFLLAGVNDLTLINETYGYDVGDEVITAVGRRIGRALRGRDCVGRFSSNKFGIVLTDCSKEGLEAIARRLMATIRDHVIETSVGAVAVSISIGAVLLPDHAGNAQSAISRALQALDLVRGNRGDRLGLYQPCERRESERRRSIAIADEVVRALNDRRMILALQPIVTSRSHEPELYECLLRMKRLDGSIVSAGEFIPVAEQFGLAKLVDHRALELAVELLRSMPNIKLSLNVSAATATDPQWLQGLEAYIGKDAGLAERLTVEITETAAISNLDETAKFVAALKALGCRVALDDFGAGYTSFRNLRLLGVDMVKIDGSFVENLGTQAEDELFVKTLIELAKSFGITTVGEWVGDAKTEKLLEQAGVAYMQGYFFGAPEIAKPVPAKSAG